MPSSITGSSFSKKIQFTTTTSSLNSKNIFSENFHLATSKVHRHHSHVTNKIPGYAHNFCDWRVREISIWKHVLRTIFLRLIFSFFCILKGVWLSAGSTEDLKIIGKNLTSINYGNLEKFLKFIDTIKYY